MNLASHPTAYAFPTFNFADGSITSIGQDRVGQTISGTVQLTDNLTRIQGKHTLRFGLDIRRQRFNALMYFAPSDDYGNFTFSGTSQTTPLAIFSSVCRTRLTSRSSAHKWMRTLSTGAFTARTHGR